jgi:hypothetical protein
MTVTVKQNDKHPTTWKVNMSLVGATVRLLASKSGTTIPLACTITDVANGVVTHVLDGTLVPGIYRVELEVTRGAEIITFPNGGYEELKVVKDLG